MLLLRGVSREKRHSEIQQREGRGSEEVVAHQKDKKDQRREKKSEIRRKKRSWRRKVFKKNSTVGLEKQQRL